MPAGNCCRRGRICAPARTAKREEGSGSEGVAADVVAANPEQQRNRHRSDGIHERRTDGLRAHRTEVGVKQTPGGLFEAQHFPKLHVESFDDAVAGDGLVQDVLDLGQFVLAPARGLPHLAADSAG